MAAGNWYAQPHCIQYLVCFGNPALYRVFKFIHTNSLYPVLSTIAPLVKTYGWYDRYYRLRSAMCTTHAGFDDAGEIASIAEPSNYARR